MEGKKNWLCYGFLIVLTGIITGFLALQFGSWTGWEEYGYLGVFLLAFIANATIILPMPLIGISVPLAVKLAVQTNLFSVVLIYALGATLGEAIGYFIGLGGKKITNIEGISYYQKAKGWLKRYGKWAILGLSFQPVLPFDIIGIVAGTLKYPFWEFFIFCFLGRIPKYLILVGSGLGIWQMFLY